MNKDEIILRGIDEIPMFTFNTETKEFSVLGHKFEGVNSIEDFINYIHNLDKENEELQQKVNQLEEENRKLINNKYDTIYLIQDLACYDRETNSYCNSIKYYDVHKIIDELEGGSNE